MTERPTVCRRDAPAAAGVSLHADPVATPRAPRRLAAAATATAALLLSACTTLIPPYERPASPVPQRWTLTPADATAAGPAAADLSWSDFIVDARMRELVAIALRNNRDLRVAVLNVEQTRALYGVQRAERLPTVGVGASVLRSSAGATDAYGAGLTIASFEIDLFGRVRSLSEAAFARYVASDEGRRAATLSLIAAVVNTELALRADAELLRVTDRTLASREEAYRLDNIRFEGGVTAEPELRASESLLAGARASLAALRRQRAQDANALALLIGQPLPADLPPATPLDDVALPRVPAGLSSDVLLLRPDIRQAEQQLIAANAVIGAARAAFFPRLSLTGSAGLVSRDLSGLLDNAGWSFTGQLLQPLFDAGRNRANLESVGAARAIAVAQYERAIQVAFREVADALAARATLADQLAAQRVQAEAETRRSTLADLLLQAGAASQLDRLDAERSQLAARQAVVQLQLAQLQNAVLLWRVLGGGSGAIEAVAATSAN